MPYSQVDMQTASGLHPGASLTKDSLQAAAQTLMDTGAFDDLNTSLDGPFKTVTVLFKGKPVPQRLPGTFDNFGWWQPEELNAELHKRVPLYNGSLPEAGSLSVSAQKALTSMLAEKGVTATVSSVLQAAAPGRPVAALEFSIDSPEIRLQTFDLAGVSPELAPAVAKIVTRHTNQPYSEAGTGSGVREAVLNLYRDAGYLDASLEDLHRSVGTTGSIVNVKLAATLQAGDIYRATAVTWPGTAVAKPDICDAPGNLHAGDIASQKALHACVTRIANAYKQLGYLDVGVDAAPTIDRSAHHVAYVLSAVPGEQYRLQTVSVTGLNEAQRRDFDRVWHLRQGDLYDPDYPATFLKQNIASPSLTGMMASYKVVADTHAHLVDLTITFKPFPRS